MQITGDFDHTNIKHKLARLETKQDLRAIECKGKPQVEAVFQYGYSNGRKDTR